MAPHTPLHHMAFTFPIPCEPCHRHSHPRCCPADIIDDVTTPYSDVIASPPLDVRTDTTTTTKLTTFQLPPKSPRIVTSTKDKSLPEDDLATAEEDCLDTAEELHHQQMELVISMGGKLNELRDMGRQIVAKVAMNEELGARVAQTVRRVCGARHVSKYLVLVDELDKIVNLLTSLRTRLARVDRALLCAESRHEVVALQQKQRKIIEQQAEAKMLKERIDRKQKLISEIFAEYFNQDQFADYENYVATKTMLIVERRELDEKTRFGEAQMRSLVDSLTHGFAVHNFLSSRDSLTSST